MGTGLKAADERQRTNIILANIICSQILSKYIIIVGVAQRRAGLFQNPRNVVAILALAVYSVSS